MAALQALLTRFVPPSAPGDGYRAVKDHTELLEGASPEPAGRQSPRLLSTTPSGVARSAALFVLGVLAASVVWGLALSRPPSLDKAERAFQAAKAGMYDDLDAQHSKGEPRARAYGPRPRRPVTWREGFKTPGPKEVRSLSSSLSLRAPGRADPKECRQLLQGEAPGTSLYESLRPDLRYLVRRSLSASRARPCQSDPLCALYRRLVTLGADLLDSS